MARQPRLRTTRTRQADRPLEPWHIGCAGWSIPRVWASRFPGSGTHLARYARVFPAVEINSSFYRSHRPETYARWANATPEQFRFAVKVPKEMTHTRRLVDVGAPLDAFLDEVAGLGAKLGPLLVQLPPSLAFDAKRAASFFDLCRARYRGALVCEPRHPSWFGPEADRLFERFEVARVAADPPPVAEGGEPGGWEGLHYYRLHGAPRRYYSEYSRDALAALARRVRAARCPVWCIFDNTASGAAVGNAFDLLDLLKGA